MLISEKVEYPVVYAYFVLLPVKFQLLFLRETEYEIKQDAPNQMESPAFPE